MKANAILAIAAAMLISSCTMKEYRTDLLGVEVTPDENREYSYTDKKSGYWYGMTHHQTTECWLGSNLANMRILSVY